MKLIIYHLANNSKFLQKRLFSNFKIKESENSIKSSHALKIQSNLTLFLIIRLPYISIVPLLILLRIPTALPY